MFNMYCDSKLFNCSRTKFEAIIASVLGFFAKFSLVQFSTTFCDVPSDFFSLHFLILSNLNLRHSEIMVVASIKTIVSG